MVIKMTWKNILKEAKYPCDACGEMTPDSQLLSITGKGIDPGNPHQICRSCHEREEKERMEREEYYFWGSGEK